MLMQAMTTARELHMATLLPNGKVLGFASAGPAYRKLHSDFRTTAKCVRLLALLLDR